MRTRKVGLLSRLLDYYSRAVIARRGKGLLRRAGRCTRTKPSTTGEHSSVIIFFLLRLFRLRFACLRPSSAWYTDDDLAANYLKDLSRSLGVRSNVRYTSDRSIDRSTDPKLSFALIAERQWILWVLLRPSRFSRNVVVASPTLSRIIAQHTTRYTSLYLKST